MYHVLACHHELPGWSEGVRLRGTWELGLSSPGAASAAKVQGLTGEPWGWGLLSFLRLEGKPRFLPPPGRALWTALDMTWVMDMPPAGT